MNENELRTLLIEATSDRPPGLDLMAAVPAGRARRERRPARALIPLAAVGVAAAVAMSVILVALPGAQPSAQAQVVAAVDATSQQSYRIHGTSTGDTRTFEGAYDPVQRTGVITAAGEDTETRFIGDQMYVREQGSTKWTVFPRPDVQSANTPVIVAVVKFAALDPQQALQRLRSATDVRESGSASGPGWTGRRFTYSLKDTAKTGRPPLTAETITGSVDVDDQGRVRRVETDFSSTGQRNVADFSDFGTPVTVTAPPASEVEQAPTKEQSGEPKDKPLDPKASGKAVGGVEKSGEPVVKNR